MVVKTNQQRKTMPAWSHATVLHSIDSIAIAIAHGYILPGARLASHPSLVVRLTAIRDAASWDAQMLERKLAVFHQQREQIPRQRPHYTPTHQLETLFRLLTFDRVP